MQIPILTKQAHARKAAGVVGAGENIWPHIRHDDSKYSPLARFVQECQLIAVTQ